LVIGGAACCRNPASPPEKSANTSVLHREWADRSVFRPRRGCRDGKKSFANTPDGKGQPQLPQPAVNDDAIAVSR